MDADRKLQEKAHMGKGRERGSIVVSIPQCSHSKRALYIGLFFGASAERGRGPGTNGGGSGPDISISSRFQVSICCATMRHRRRGKQQETMRMVQPGGARAAGVVRGLS